MIYLMLQQAEFENRLTLDPAARKMIKDHAEHEVQYLYGIWKDIIIRFSDKKIDELRPYLQEVLRKLISQLQSTILRFIPTKSLGSQLDEPIVKLILVGCSVTSDVPTIDKIYERTKAAMSRYFYDRAIVSAYLNIGEFDKAQKVLQCLLDKNHISYWYRILHYEEDNYRSKDWLRDFVDFLVYVKRKAKIKLLASGEKLNIGEVSYNDLLEIIESVKKIKNQNQNQNQNKNETVSFFTS
jgi:disulfide oxidoreductase YuzD